MAPSESITLSSICQGFNEQSLNESLHGAGGGEQENTSNKAIAGGHQDA